MNNYNKAKNIAKHILETYPVINKNNLPNALWFSALEMAEWKEKQMIDKACEWLKKHLTFEEPRTGEKACVLNLSYFRQAMEE